MIGKAVAHGAVTIINAISCGMGAGLGINLKTEAVAELTNEPRQIECHILPNGDESTSLIENVVRRVLRHFHLEDEYGALVETRSNIPIARGLKSSSVAANAITLAVLAALGKKVDDMTAINLAVDAALDAGVTITGAFDDACASYFGNIVITDNYERRILRQSVLERNYPVLIHVPPRKAYTAESDVERMKLVSNEVKALHGLALSGEYWAAMTLNGFVYSAVIGYNPKIAVDALSAGALAAGLSGKGPAVVAVAQEENVEKIRDIWKQYGGKIIEAKTNHEKAHKLM